MSASLDCAGFLLGSRTSIHNRRLGSKHIILGGRKRKDDTEVGKIGD
jgi:hypothetical protein